VYLVQMGWIVSEELVLVCKPPEWTDGGVVMGCRRDGCMVGGGLVSALGSRD
jgi:hypothetical protein